MTPEAQLLELITEIAQTVIADLGPGAEHMKPQALGFEGPRDLDLRSVFGPIDFEAWRAGILGVVLLRLDCSVWIGTDDGMRGIPLGDGAMGFVVQLANNFADQAAEDSPSYGSPIPACDLHSSHPMNATVVNRVAVWRCSVDDTVVRPINLDALSR